MTEQKSKVYLGFLPKDEIFKFIEEVKKALGEAQKAGDKKTFKIEIKGTTAEPKGISFETYSFEEKSYGEFLDASQDYMGKALSALTFSVGAKDEGSVTVLKDLFEKMKPIFEALPFVASKQGKYEIHFRAQGKKVYVDFISLEGEFFKPFLDLNLNLAEFHQFKASLKSEFSPADFFNLPVEELSLKFLQLVLSINAESNNAKYLLTAIIKALKAVKLTNEKFQAKKDKYVEYLNAINAFVGAEFTFDFDAKELCAAGLAATKQLPVGANINENFAAFKTNVEGFFTNVLVPMLEQQQLIDAVKATDIDEISIAFGMPKYKTGIAHVVKIPGFSKAFIEKFLDKK